MTKIKILSIPAILLVCVLFFSSCQATPEREAVVVKNGADIQERAAQQQSAPPDYKYEHPSQYTADFSTSSGKLNVSVNASVTAAGEKLPVVKISPDPISEQQAVSISGIFFADAPYLSSSVSAPTKQDIEEAIVELKRGDSDLADVDRAAYDEMIKEDIAALEEMYKTAPEQNSPVAFDGKYGSQPQPNALDPYPYQLVYGDDVQTIDVSGKGLSGTDARLIIEKDGMGRSAFEYVEQRGGNRIGDVGDSVVQPIEMSSALPQISLEQAQKQAEELVEKLDLGDFTLASVGAALEGSYPSGNDEPQFDDMPKTYVFNFVQGGVLPMNYVSNHLNEVDYTSAWDYQALTIFIDDKGIGRVIFRSPFAVDEIVSENVELLPFDDIAKRIEDNLKNHYEPSEPEVLKVEMNIDSIKLGLGRIAQNEDFSQCLLVPVWDVYGTVTTTYVDDLGTDFELGHSYLTVNALDGSIINRAAGY